MVQINLINNSNRLHQTDSVEKCPSWKHTRAIRAVSPRNPVWKLANSSKLPKGDLEKLFARVKRMNGVDDDKYWRKRPPWKQSNYLRSMKSDKALQKLKSNLHVASRNEWQSDYGTPGEISHYYSIVKREL